MTLLVLLRLAVTVFVVASLAGVGLRLPPDELRRAARDRRLIGLTLCGSWIVCPLITVAVLWLLPVAQPFRGALLLLAFAPAAPFAPKAIQQARGDEGALACFMVLSAAGTMLVMSLVAPMVVEAPGVGWLVARSLLLFMVLPLALGMAIRAASPEMARRLGPLSTRLASLSGAVALVGILVRFGPSLLTLVGTFAIAAQVLTLAVTTGALVWLARLLPPPQQPVLVIGVATRNLGAVLAVLAAVDADRGGVLMVVVSGILTAVLSAMLASRYARRAAVGSA